MKRFGYNSVWYWPGMERDPQELSTLLAYLTTCGITVRTVSAPYDIGPLPSEPASRAHQEVMESDTAPSNWWIGLSLGAAVAHIVCSTVCTANRPTRLTLINPFADRLELSRILHFALDDQWPLRPDKYPLPRGTVADLVLSSRDERIPPEQGLRLHSLWGAVRSRVVWTNSDHVISDTAEQRRLAESLLHIPQCYRSKSS